MATSRIHSFQPFAYCQPIATEDANECHDCCSRLVPLARLHGFIQILYHQKGDPRMHKAVVARLANPDISLFDALKIGGFEYGSNDDATLIDSEKVTLGQRKNQLSRRLRLARKTRSNGDDNGDDSSLLKALPHTAGASGGDGGAPTSKVAARALQMKHEADSAFGEDDLTSTTTTKAETLQEQMEQSSKRPRMAKFHPDFVPVVVPPASFRSRNDSFDSTLRNMAGVGSVMDGGSSSVPGLASPSVGGGYAHSETFPSQSLPYGAVGTTSYPPPYTNAFHAHPLRASAVAVSSLTSSAQTVGLTLEQLALALSSNTTALAKLVSDTRSGESMVQQQELALNLYKSEVKTLYTRCMLMAGIDPSLAQPHTSTYLDFASKAWQKEGKRLEEIMGKAREANGASGPSELDQAAATGAVAAGAMPKLAPDQVLAADEDGETADSKAAATPAALTLKLVDSKTKSQAAHGHHDSNCNANHIHQLGQCGHRAIIHHPAEGSPHIDFIVGDHVECYSGIESLPLGHSMDSVWPSQYKCKDVDEDSCSAKKCAKTAVGTSLDGYWSANDSVGGTEPKLLKLSDINLQDPEWNYDSDGGLMGLFKLGENENTGDDGENRAEESR